MNFAGWARRHSQVGLNLLLFGVLLCISFWFEEMLRFSVMLVWIGMMIQAYHSGGLSKWLFCFWVLCLTTAASFEVMGEETFALYFILLFFGTVGVWSLAKLIRETY